MSIYAGRAMDDGQCGNYEERDDLSDIRAEPGDPCPGPIGPRLREIAAGMSPGWPDRVRLEALADELAQREQITLNAPGILERMAIVEDLRESGLADGLRRAAGILVQLGMGGDAGEAVEFDAQELQGHPPVRA